MPMYFFPFDRFAVYVYAGPFATVNFGLNDERWVVFEWAVPMYFFPFDRFAVYVYAGPFATIDFGLNDERWVAYERLPPPRCACPRAIARVEVPTLDRPGDAVTTTAIAPISVMNTFIHRQSFLNRHHVPVLNHDSSGAGREAGSTVLSNMMSRLSR